MTDPCPPHFNLGQYVLEGDVRDPHAPMLIVRDGRGHREVYRRKRVLARVTAMQRRLREAGIEAGERVLIQLPSDADFAFAHLALTALGCIAVPLSPMLTDPEVRYIAEDSAARARIVGHDGEYAEIGLAVRDIVARDTTADAERAEPIFAPTAADDPAYLVYTSGTTGDPKGVLHAHRSVWGRRPMRAGWTDIGAGDVVVHAGALNWTYTMGIAVYDAWRYGACSVIHTGPKEPGVWAQVVREEHATHFAAVPGVYRQLLKYGRDLRSSFASLRAGLTAGEALSPALLHEFTETTGKPLREALGMSECSTYLSSPPDKPQKPGSPGVPQPGRRVAVVTEGDAHPEPLPTGQTGLLAVHRSDPGLMLRYWNDEHATKAVFRGEWFVGGDLAHVDQDGYYWFEGRANDLMNAFGYRVSPDEVEAAIDRHPDVHDCGVAEARVRDDVSVVCAYIVTDRPFDAFESLVADLKELAATTLADYKRPREYRRLNALPRTRSGKIQRKNLESAWRAEQLNAGA